VLIFDTETTGLPIKTAALNDPSQPHLMQLAYIYRDGDVERARVNLLVASGVDPHPRAEAVHGISRDLADRCGLCERIATEMFFSMLTQSDLVVAHNMAFDSWIMNIALGRYTPAGSLPIYWPSIYCTMEQAKIPCKVPATAKQIAAGFARPGHYKAPTLAEAVRILCGHELEGAHDAMADVIGCAEVFDKLADPGVRLHVHRQEGAA
jgi:DNA polymerase-3 subunit epsilon